MTFHWLDHMTSPAPTRAAARATSPPNALLRASEGTRPVAAPDEDVAEVLEDEADMVVEEDITLGVALVEFPDNAEHWDC